MIVQKSNANMLYSCRLSLDILGSTFQRHVEALGRFQGTVCLFILCCFLLINDIFPAKNKKIISQRVSETPFALDAHHPRRRSAT